VLGVERGAGDDGTDRLRWRGSVDGTAVAGRADSSIATG
jgi:hypothetical protein